MKHHKFAAGFALAGLIILGTAGPISAGEQVPFKGSAEGDLTRTPLEAPFVFDEFFMSGNSTQLGQFDLLIEATVNTATRTATGNYLFVAANGDMLTATFTGSSMPTATPGVILITEVATIDPGSGTGRFAGATGNFSCERLFDTARFITIGTINGTISSPGAN
jgi:hypothetical protein